MSAPATEALPDDLEHALAQLTLLDTAALVDAARSRMAVTAAERLEDLNLKRQREGLTLPEHQESAVLIRHYERVMLVRAQAAVLLKQQGYDLSQILTGL